MEPDIDTLRTQAEQGHASAQFLLGDMYRDGNDVPQNFVLAHMWYNLAASRTTGEARENAVAGRDKVAGRMTAEQVTEAQHLAHIRTLAEQGNAEAQNSLGSMYRTGEGVPQDAAEAVHWFRLAAEQRHALGQLNLARMYRDGHGVPQHYTEAVYWFRLAIEQGDAAAKVSLGFMCDNGHDAPNDNAELVRWYRLAAEQGYTRAEYNLGFMYADGRGVPQDDVQAHMWYNLAASRMTSEFREAAVEGRDEVASRMTADQLTEAQRLAREWAAAHPREP